MQLQHLPQQLQQQHLQVQQHGQIPGLQRPLIPQQQPQLYPRQQLVSPQRQQSPLQPHQAQHSQLQQQQLQMHLQQQQQQVLNQPQAQQQEGHLAVHRVASPIPGSSNGSGVSSSANALRISPLASRQPQPNRGAPQGASKPAGVMGGAAAAGASPVSAAPIEAVQIAARPGSASTVADLVREAIEAAEAAEYDADSYGEAREADEGFAEDDLLDFTEDSELLLRFDVLCCESSKRAGVQQLALWDWGDVSKAHRQLLDACSLKVLCLCLCLVLICSCRADGGFSESGGGCRRPDTRSDRSVGVGFRRRTCEFISRVFRPFRTSKQRPRRFSTLLEGF